MTENNTSLFMSCARKLEGNTLRLNVDTYSQKGGLNINKDFLRDKKILNLCWDYVVTYLGNIVDSPAQLEDDRFMRDLVLKVAGLDKNLFLNSDGTFELGFENALILYHKYKRNANVMTNARNGLRYALLYRELKQEFESLYKASSKGVIAPIYELNSQFFTWRRAPEITRKYSLYATQPAGYKCYYYEKNNLAQTVFLYVCGKTLKEASVITDAKTCGILFPFLPIDIEEKLMPYILAGRVGNYEGEYKKKLQAFEGSMFDKYESELYTVYNMKIKPHMIEMMGAFMDVVLTEVKQYHPEFEYLDTFIYHVSPQRFGIAVKDCYNIEDVLPESHKLFKPVTKPLFTDIAEGLYL